MLIYRHHTVAEIIDLDDLAGHWIPFEKRIDNPVMVGLMPMAMRVDFDVRGSFTVEGEKRYCLYWNDENELVFRANDQRIRLLRLAADGGLIDLAPGLTVELQPATYGDGRAMRDMSVFTMADPDSGWHVEVLYDSGRYLQYYLGNFTFVPDEDLSHWDFFVHVKRSLEELRMLARASTPASIREAKSIRRSDAPAIVRTAEPASRTGIWAAAHHLDRRCRLDIGEVAPDVDGLDETWVWVAD